MSKNTKKTASGLSLVSDVLSAAGGLAGMLTDTSYQASFAIIVIGDIRILVQHRDKNRMGNEEQSLEELAADIAHQGVLQPVIICRNNEGPEEWRLIAGERRIRAALMAGMSDIPAMAYGELTEEQIDAIQYAENVHRLNLEMIEEANVLAKDLEALGSAEAVAAKRNKSPAWVSKRLGLLTLGPQATRLLTESVSNDLELIGNVSQIEKIDTGKAAEVVETLKAERGKKGTNARETVQKVKDEVKPPKKPRVAKAKPSAPANPDNVAKAPDTAHTQAGPVVQINPEGGSHYDLEPDSEGGSGAGGEDSPFTDPNENFADAKAEAANSDAQEGGQETGQDAQHADEQDGGGSDKAPALPPVEALDNAYTRIVEGSNPRTVLDQMGKPDQGACKSWLTPFYELGMQVKPKTLGMTVARNFKTGTFATTGHGLFALVAFLTGTEEGGVFNMLDILGTAKP